MAREYGRDFAWQQHLSEKFLDPFYRSRGWHVDRHAPNHPMQFLHVDVTLTKMGEQIRIDEKIIRGLRKGGRADKVNLETWSCSKPGWERRGWMSPIEPSRASVLLICHAEEICDFSPDAWKQVTYLDCLWIPFAPLRDWFWQRGEESWEKLENNQFNQSIARKVPIREITESIKGVARFTVRAPAQSASAAEPRPSRFRDIR